MPPRSGSGGWGPRAAAPATPIATRSCPWSYSWMGSMVGTMSVWAHTRRAALASPWLRVSGLPPTMDLDRLDRVVREAAAGRHL
eukprot:6793079-Alexandrium_andersonii.AAC.2